MDSELVSAENKLSTASQIKTQASEDVVVDQGCVLHDAVLLLADKWTVPILLSLMQGPKRTHQLLKQIYPISPKMLVQTLKKLEDAELTERKVYPVVPPMVEYSLTETGWGLNEVLSKLLEWSVNRATKKKELKDLSPSM